MNKETKTRLTLLAKNNKANIEEVTDKFQKYYKESNDERLALYATINDYRRTKQFQTFAKNRPQRESDILYGFIVGTRGLWDKAETIRNTAKRFIEKNGIQAAQEQDLVDGENHILDTRRQIYGRPNSDFGKPLKEELHVLDMMLYGYFRHNGDKVYKFGSIQTSNNPLARAWDRDIVQKNRYFTSAQVNAIIDSEDKEDITLRATTAQGQESIFKAFNEKLDIKAIIDKSTKFTSLKDCEKLYEQMKMPNGKLPWDSKTIVKGIVTWINTDKPDGIGRITMQMMNPDNEEETLRVRIDPSITIIDFGELSEVYVFGKLQRSKYKDRGTGKLEDGDVVVDAFGIYVITKTPRTRGVEEATSEEDVIDGWLE